MVYPFRIASGFITKAALQSNPSNLIKNFPRAFDQPAHIPWLLGTPIVEDGFRRSVGMNGYAKFFGLRSMTLVVYIMTPGMYDIWVNRFFLNDNQTGPVTFEIPDKRKAPGNQALVMRGLMQKPTRDSLTLVSARIWREVPFVVDRCEVLP